MLTTEQKNLLANELVAVVLGSVNLADRDQENDLYDSFRDILDDVNEI